MKWYKHTIKGVLPLINKLISHTGKKLNKFSAIKNAKWRVELIKGVLDSYIGWGFILQGQARK